MPQVLASESQDPHSTPFPPYLGAIDSRSFILFARQRISAYLPAPWDFGSHATGLASVGEFRLKGRLRPVPTALLAQLSDEGLATTANTGLGYRLDAVESLLMHVPDLASIVAARVGVIYPLVAEPGYDVSHSQPQWPNLIFVSFPEREDLIGDMRLTESIVHEAMHLHLTVQEGRSPLVARYENSLYSPWMDTSRSVQGVLHGVFVFRCISAFLRRLTGSTALPSDANRHVATRLDEIQQQLAEIDSPVLEQSLTPRGVDLLRSWAASAVG